MAVVPRPILTLGVRARPRRVSVLHERRQQRRPAGQGAPDAEVGAADVRLHAGAGPAAARGAAQHTQIRGRPVQQGKARWRGGILWKGRGSVLSEALRGAGASHATRW